ncbi:MAG: MFS transporter [Bryobacterales bacterium]|nr:MFS transporter [Bryobacterales bacterium]
MFPALLLSVVAVIFARFAPGEGPLETSAAPSTSRWSQLSEVVCDPAIQTIAVAYFFIKFTRYAFLFWLPLYMVQRLGYTQADAGYTSSAFELVGFTGVLAAGYLSDRVFKSRRYPVGALMLAGLSIACLVHPTLSAQGWWGNLLGISLIGALVFGPEPGRRRQSGGLAAGLSASAPAASCVIAVVRYWGGTRCSPLLMAALGSWLATRWIGANSGWAGGWGASAGRGKMPPGRAAATVARVPCRNGPSLPPYRFHARRLPRRRGRGGP